VLRRDRATGRWTFEALVTAGRQDALERRLGELSRQAHAADRAGARARIPAAVGAGNCVTSCDLRVFVDQAAEPIPAQNAHTGHVSR
jgi:hypothetical protein